MPLRVTPIQHEVLDLEFGCIHEWFEQQAERTPHALAVVSGVKRITYCELNERANQLAHRLLRLGAGRDMLIGIYIDRSIDQVVGILGILKAGAAYVPLDLNFPADRLGFILEDTRAPFLVTRTELLPALPSNASTPVCLDDQHAPLDDEPIDNPSVGVSKDDLAYVLFTSGSTGHPKGVMMAHSGMANYLTWCIRAYTVSEGSGAPVHSPLSFDLTVTSLFAPLLAGLTVQLVPESPGVEALVAALRRRADFSLVKITPAHLEMLARELSPDEAPGLTQSFIIGGENLTYAQIAFWQSFAPGTALINEYGPTEAAVGCCVYHIPTNEQGRGSVPIGRAIANTRLYVLDTHFRPVPPGESGELFIAGASLARGYLGRPDLTAKQFLPDAFGQEPGSRMYRTGDVVRTRADGNLEFLGRNDEQVKIRGYRVEPAEVEATLGRHPDVGSAVVVARRGHSGVERLAAYVVLRPNSRLEPETLRQFLKDWLPTYMVPASVQFLDTLPLNRNGKVDRGALPTPRRADFAVSDPPALPRSVAEDHMARIWERVLGIGNIGIGDEFTDLGGDSLSALRLTTEIEREFGVRLSPALLFTEGTIERVVKLLDRPGLPDRPLVPFFPGSRQLPFFCVHGIGGEVLSFATLARYFAPDQPFFGLRARTSETDRPGQISIEDLANDYLEEVRAVQPEGPYFLGGFSFGGIVAYEMARLLCSRGEQVALLVVIDQVASEHERLAVRSWLNALVAIVANIPFWIRYDLLRTDLTSMLSRLRVKVRGAWRKMTKSRLAGGVDDVLDVSRLPSNYAAVIERLYRASLSYTPRPYAGDVNLVKARAQPLLQFAEHDLGWGRLAKDGVRVWIAPGNHDNMLVEPYVQSLARLLKECIRSARAEIAVDQTALPPDSSPEHSYLGMNGDGSYQVVTNSRGDFSIWPIGSDSVSGWFDVGFCGTQDECLEYIQKNWVDMKSWPESSNLALTRDVQISPPSTKVQ